MTARTTTAVAAGLIGLGMLAGCPDPSQKFDEFIARKDASGQGQGGSAFCPSAAPMGMDANGEYFFSLLPTELSPDKPAPFLATITVANGELTLELLPLNADDRTSVAVDAMTMMEVGTQTFGPFPIADDGTVEITLNGAIVPGDTNPISTNDLTVDAVLTGAFCTETDALCGDFSGVVTA